MASPMSRFAGFASTACLALAIVVGLIDSAQVAAQVSGSPAHTIAAFATVTPAVGTIA